MKRFLPILILFILTSCEGPRSKKGTVYDSKTKEPLSEVTIRFYGKESKTDSLGQFDISAFIGCTTKCNDFEVYFEKNGYETLYVNFSREFDKEVIGGQLVDIYLKSTRNEQPTFAENKLSNRVRIYSWVMLLISTLTFLISLFLKVRFKILWIALVLSGNFLIGYNVITNEYDLDIFNSIIAGIYRYKWDNYFIPLGTFAYWVYYFGFYRRLTTKTSEFIADEKPPSTQQSAP
jgi:hypothetical protein